MSCVCVSAFYTGLLSADEAIECANKIQEMSVKHFQVSKTKTHAILILQHDELMGRLTTMRRQRLLLQVKEPYSDNVRHFRSVKENLKL